MNFSDLKVGDSFYFAYREDQKLYTKEEEKRRPYTPEAYTNASFLWQRTKHLDDIVHVFLGKDDPRPGTIISEGKTFFYVTPGTEVKPVVP